MKFEFSAFLAATSIHFAFSEDLVLHNRHQPSTDHPQDEERKVDVGILTEVYAQRRLFSPQECQVSPDLSCCQNNAICESRNNIDVGNNTCVGIAACESYTGPSYFRAGQDSCHGWNACGQAADHSGALIVGDHACLYNSACFGAGRYGGNLTVSDFSCQGLSACAHAGSTSPSVIGRGSCIGFTACYAARMVTIGDKSCTCDGCCSNLKPGSIIGDCQCTKTGDECSNQDTAVYKPESRCPPPGLYSLQECASSSNNPYCCQGAASGYFACQGRSEIFVGNNTCVGIAACEQYFGPPGYFRAGQDSCHGWNACGQATDRSGALIVGDRSCLYDSACFGAGRYGGNLTVSDFSCQGISACAHAGSTSPSVIGRGSCIGSAACFAARMVTIGDKSCTCDGCCSNLKPGSIIGDCQCTKTGDECSDQDTAVYKPESRCPPPGFYSHQDCTSSSSNPFCCQGDFACNRRDGILVGNNTCVGTAACESYGHGYFRAGQNSCLGWNTCSYAADDSGAFYAGDGSCVQDQACSHAGRAGNLKVGDYSCRGEQACLGAGRDSASTIGGGSCLGRFSCEHARGVSIGDKACTCEGCCQNLKPGSIIGDCQCTKPEDNCGSQGLPVNKTENICPLTGANLHLTFNESTNMLGLTTSNVKVNLNPLVKTGNRNETIQHLEFNNATNKLMLSDSTIEVDLSHLHQELTFDAQTMRLGLKDTNIGVNLSSLTKPGIQNLTFDPSTSYLGLTGSNATVNLNHLINDDQNELQDLFFNDTTNELWLSNSTAGIIDLSHLEQDLIFDDTNLSLRLTNAKTLVDLSALAKQENQNLTFDESQSLLGLTGSDVKVNLTSLLTDNQDELQDLAFNNATNELMLTKSTGHVVDLSHLDRRPQELKFNPNNMSLGLTDSTNQVDLSSMAQHSVQNLTLDETNGLLGLTNSDVKVNISSLVNVKQVVPQERGSTTRVTMLQASVAEIDGDPFDGTVTSRTRRLKGHKEEPPEIRYGGAASDGFALISSGQIVGMSITAKYSLTEGTFKVGIADCTNLNNIRSLVSGTNALTLLPNGSRLHVVKFELPIRVDAGMALCFQATRINEVESEEKHNEASLVLMLEQF